MEKIIAHLSKDKKLKGLMDRLDTPKSNPYDEDVYLSLTHSIVSQQLSSKAANTIYNRFLGLFDDGYPKAEIVLEFSLEEMRTAGVSKQKANYIKNVAQFFTDNQLFDKDWSSLSDDVIIKELTQIKGVGKWTVQMILMFTLGRPDVFPIDDLVVRNNMIRLYGVETKGKVMRQTLETIAAKWSPYRSWGSRYIWKWKDEGLSKK